MGRRSNPKLASLRQEALRLENKGLSVAQVAKRVRRHRDTVKTWLRQDRGGPKQLKTFKSAVLAQLEEGRGRKEIAIRVGCSAEHVRRIEREQRGYLKYRSAQTMIEEFLADPEGCANKRFTRYPSFGKALIARCNQATNTNPKAAGELIDLAIAQFSLLRAKARKAKNAKHFTCNLVQAKAISAARQRVLQRPEAALQILHEVQAAHNGCQACTADLARRESIILRDLKRFSEALGRLQAAQNLYERLGHSGHDGDNNGLGNCALVESTIHYLMGHPAAVIRTTERALQRLVSPSEQNLFWKIRFNRALSLLEFPDSSNIARQLARELSEECGSEASIPRMYAVFLMARSAEIENDTHAALRHYEDAYEDALQLEIPEYTAALLSDIEKLSPNPVSLKSRINRLRNWRDGKPLKNFPPWLHPISPALISSYQLSSIDIHGALTVLRGESGGNKVLPRNAAMAAA